MIVKSRSLALPPGALARLPRSIRGVGVIAPDVAAFETEIAALRGMCRSLVSAHSDGPGGSAGPTDASVVKLYYSELLQRMMDFGV